jgi:hypothetical protein
VHRQRGERAPDVRAVVLPSGEVLGPEVKSRKRLPRVLVGALEQASRYYPAAIPVALVAELGGRMLAVLDARSFARLVGVAPEALPTKPRRRRPVRSGQLTLAGVPQ